MHTIKRIVHYKFANLRLSNTLISVCIDNTMDVDGIVEKTVKIVPFTGKKEDWNKWSKKFLAQAKYKGFREALEGKQEVPAADTELDPDDDDDKKKIKARKANDMAYNVLILSVEDDVSFNAVDTAVTTELPDGSAALAWQRLKLRWQPTTMTTRFELEAEFANSRLTDTTRNPEEWIAELEQLKIRITSMGGEVTNERMVGHIISNLPTEYDATVEYIQREIVVKKVTPPIEEVQLMLRTKFKLMDNRSKSLSNKETALAAFTKQFKGRCRTCGEFGHKAVDCKKIDKKKFNGECFYCHKKGHKASECFKKKKDEKNNKNDNANVASETAEVVLMAQEKELVLFPEDEMVLQASDVIENHKNIWIIDSRATSHMTNSKEGFIDTKEINVDVKIGNGKTLKATMMGTKRCVALSKDGSTTDVKIEMKYIPGLWTNLLSMTQLMQKGFSFTSKGMTLVAMKGTSKLVFDQEFRINKNACLIGIKIVPKLSETALPSMPEGEQLSLNKMHLLFGHIHENMVRKSATYYGWKVTGPMKVCVDCAIGKAQQKRLVKEAGESNTPGECMLIDISSVKGLSYGRKKFWLLAMDEYSSYKWSFFLNAKSETSKMIRSLLQLWKDKYNKTTKYIQCDNAGENMALKDACQKDFPTIIFEFTAPGTPQQNGKAERAFTTLYGRVRSMLNHARFPAEVRTGLWAECARTATMLDNLVFHGDHVDSPPWLLFGLPEPKWIHHLHTFGEMAVAAKHENKKIRGKLEDCGNVCIFVGYSDNHAGDVHRFLKLSTKSIFHSRDLIWLDKLYGDYFAIPVRNRTVLTSGYELGEPVILDQGGNQTNDHEQQNTQNEEAETEDETENDKEDKNSDDNNNDNVPAQQPISREVRNLRTFYNPHPEREAMEMAMLSKEYNIFMGDVSDGFTEFSFNSVEASAEGMKFRDAWDHHDLSLREKWREAIRKEFRSMNERKVWRKIKRSDVPAGRKLIGSRWVFAIKRDGTFKARLVAKGYTQIPGIDFTDNFAPVINDVTFRMMIVLMIVKGWQGRIIDVVTAFLNGDLEEEVYLEVPEGYNGCNENECLLLLKSMYGLAQSARQWWKKIVSVLKSIRFKLSLADPCLMVWKKEDKMVVITIYVDDCLVIGSPTDLDFIIGEIKKTFSLKEQIDFKDFLGCEIKFNNKKTKAWLGQPHLLKRIEEKFGEEAMNIRIPKTPGTPRQIVVKSDNEDDWIGKDEQDRYRSGVGMLLYLVKHSRPDIANPVRELSKVLDGATVGQYKEMLRVIRFVLETKSYG